VLALPRDVLRDVRRAPRRLRPLPPLRLDGQSPRRALSLRRRESGTCGLLLELGGGYRRCGAHAFRPGACRAYPLVADHLAPLGGALAEHACCPVEGLDLYEAAIPEMLATLEDDRAEQALYLRVLERWEQLFAGRPPERAVPIGAFVDWLLGLYAAIQPLRAGERGDWQLVAYERIASWPLPVD
jgi:Fe-S-cluster containining protein